MLDQLPPEVLCSIFSYILPPVSWSSSRSRRKILSRLGRVSVKCARAAQTLLFEVVQLDSLPTAVSWCRTVETVPQARFLAQWRTRKLFISPGDLRMARILVERVLSTVPAVKELWLADVACNLLSVSILPQLESCFMSSVDLRLEVDSNKYLLYLPELRVLALSLCVVSIGSKVLEFSDLLCLESFPKLTALAVTWSKDTSEPEMHRLDKQLTHLFLRRVPHGRSARDEYPVLPCGELKRATSLQHLSLDLHDADEISALEAVPVELSSLRIMSNDRSQPTLIERDVLESDYTCLDSLRYLIVERVDHDEAAMREETMALCDAVAIELVEVQSSGKLEDFADERMWLRMTRARMAPVPVQRVGARAVFGAGSASISPRPEASTSAAVTTT
ncbi:hypothetical protein JCM3775_004009 [Rhodotorula graminis]